MAPPEPHLRRKLSEGFTSKGGDVTFTEYAPRQTVSFLVDVAAVELPPPCVPNL